MLLRGNRKFRFDIAPAYRARFREDTGRAVPIEDTVTADELTFECAGCEVQFPFGRSRKPRQLRKVNASEAEQGRRIVNQDALACIVGRPIGQQIEEPH
jgi:hypothetical protein